MVLLHIIYGTQKFDLDTEFLADHSNSTSQDNQNSSGDPAESEPQPNCSKQTEHTIGDLKVVIDALIGVPPQSQRLILRGKTIFGDSTPLSSLKLREKDKIMVLGTRAKPTEEYVEVSKLLSIENDEVPVISSKIDEYSKELEGIEKGHLPKKHHQDSLRSLEKKLRGVNEECMRILLRLDGITFKDGMEKARAKRKDVVKLVQKQLDAHDLVFERVKGAMG